MSYDNVGNLINDTYTNPNAGGAMDYDAENHMTAVVNGSHKYRYNADGKRVKRIIASQGEFWLVYGMGGELVAEYNASTGIPAQTSPSKEYGYRGGQMLVIAEGASVKWLVQDQLGSTRMEIGLTGNLADVTRHDYLPFGEELAGAMRVGNGYGGATNTKQKFTGYERDSETGLDFAQARYMSSVQGRFTSVDPDGIGAAITEPQSWNGYSYVGNRPTTLTDPDGLLWAYNNQTGDLFWFGGTEEQFREIYKADKGWRILDGKIFIVTRSGVENGTDFKAGHQYYLDASGEAVDLGLNYDPVRDFANQMGLRAAATKQMILIFGGGSAAIGLTGGIGASYLGFSLSSGVITLGLSEAVPVATGAAAVIANNGTSLTRLFEAMGTTSKAAGNFFGWGNRTTLSKSLSDFSRESLLANGWTRENLIRLANAYNDQVVKAVQKGLDNPAARARSQQAMDLANKFFGNK